MSKVASIKHILKYTGILGSVQGLNMLASIVRNRLASEFLGKAGIGLMSLLNRSASLVNSTTNFGLPFSAVQCLSERYEVGDEKAAAHFVCVIRTWVLWTGLLAMLVCIGLSPFISMAVKGDASLTTSIAALSPMVLAMAVTAGEISILKAAHRLKRIATIGTVGAISTLLSTVPFFYLFGMDGIVYALIVSTVTYMIVHLYFSLPVFPYRVKLFSRHVWAEGLPMVRLGIPYVAAAVAGSASALAVPAFMSHLNGYDDVGVYHAGFALLEMCASMVFVAVESDFFPRLSAVNRNVCMSNATINRQMHVVLLLIAPLMAAFVLFLPIAVPLLYASDFMEVVQMASCASFYIFFRSLSVPIAYLALAKGRSKLYLLMEVIYDVFSVFLIAGGYYFYGLMGAGVCLSVSAMVDLLMVATVYHYRLGYVLNGKVGACAIIHGFLLLSTVVSCLLLDGTIRWIAGGFLVVLSSVVSLILFRKSCV